MNSLALINRVIDSDRQDTTRHQALLNVLRSRATAREFDRGFTMPLAHIEMVLEAAALAPSAANCQPWHYIVVSRQRTKRIIADAVVAEHAKRAQGNPRLHEVDYNQMGYAPGFMVVLMDPRMTWAFPGLMDGSELDQAYHAHSERILLQSVACSTFAAHLAATSLGYETWWVSGLAMDESLAEVRQELGIPRDLRIVDFFLFGPSLLPPQRRWKKDFSQITSWEKFDTQKFRTVEQIDTWMADMKRTALEGGGPAGFIGGK